MKNIYLFFGFLVVFGSCQKENQEEIQTTESSVEKKADEGFEMYEM
jgi:hypothetical protein